MEQKLSTENILKLISLYRSHNLLWDMNSKLYRRNDLKTKAYEEIGDEMGMTPEIIKKKIRSLRSTYTGERKKVFEKKSGSGIEDTYISTLPLFKEMSFLDTSIITRKTIDNANMAALSQTCEELEEVELCNNDPAKNVNSKFDEAIQKIINEKENEFTAFGVTIAHQLQSFPEEDGYELMGVIQNIIVERKIKIRRQKMYNYSASCSTPVSDILTTAISDAEINLDEEY